MASFGLGFGSLGSGSSAQDWIDYQNRLKQNAPEYSQLANQNPALRAPISTREADIQPASFTASSAARTTSPAPTKLATNPMANLNPTGNTPAGTFFSNYEGAGLTNLVNDPNEIINAYDKFRGYSDATGKLLNQFDPLAVMRAMGVPGSQLNGDVPQLQAYQNFYDSMLQPGRYLDPRQIIDGVAAIHGAGNPQGDNHVTANDIGNAIDNKNLDPRQQVDNLANFLLSALQGSLSNDVFQSYAALLKREGDRFIQARDQAPDTIGNASFLDWMRRIYGGGLGLY